MKRMTSFAVMLAVPLSGCVTATEPHQLDADLYKQMHAAALALSTKVERGEISREEATLQLVQMQFVTLADQRNSAAVQGAAAEGPVAASMARSQSSRSVACNTVGHILLLNLSPPSTREDHDCDNAAAHNLSGQTRTLDFHFSFNRSAPVRDTTAWHELPLVHRTIAINFRDGAPVSRASKQ
jgi:hypothetical protein